MARQPFAIAWRVRIGRDGFRRFQWRIFALGAPHVMQFGTRGDAFRSHIRIGRYRRGAENDAGPRQRRRWLEIFAIAEHDARRIVNGEMMRKSETHSARGRERRAVAARPQQPNGRQHDIGRHRAHAAERMTLRKTVFRQQQQFLEAFEEFVAALWVLPHAQRIRSDRIGPRSAAKAEVRETGPAGL